MKTMKKHLYASVAVVFFGFWGCVGAGSYSGNADAGRIIGDAEISRGAALYKKGCYGQALNQFQKAYELAVSMDQQEIAAMSLNNMGNIYRRTGDPESAVLFFEAAYDSYCRTGDSNGMIQAVSNKAAALIDAGFPNAAEKELEAAEKMAAAEQIVFAPLSRNRAVLLMRRSDYSGAESLLRTTLSRISKEDVSELAATNFALGNLMLETEQHQQALEFFQEALAADRENRCSSGMAQSLAKLAVTSLLLDKPARAFEYFQRSVMMYALMGDREKVVDMIEKMEDLSQENGRELTLTVHFVERWLAGETVQPYCD